jgi:hypothetical protein
MCRKGNLRMGRGVRPAVGNARSVLAIVRPLFLVRLHSLSATAGPGPPQQRDELFLLLVVHRDAGNLLAGRIGCVQLQRARLAVLRHNHVAAVRRFAAFLAG